MDRDKRSWGDYDRSAPRTPWGPAQDGTRLEAGVWWYSTASHGGLMVSAAVANRKLSGAARHLATLWGGKFWFEEDCQWAVAFLDQPKWAKASVHKGLSSPVKPEYIESLVRTYSPQYFIMLESKFEPPKMPKVGDSVRFTRDVTFGPGFTMPSESWGTVEKITTSKMVVSSPISHFQLRLSTILVEDGTLVVENG